MKPLIVIHDAATGEIIEREMNDAELAQLEKDQNEAIERKKQDEAKAAQKAALLERLGLTANEAKLLLS